MKCITISFFIAQNARSGCSITVETQKSERARIKFFKLVNVSHLSVIMIHEWSMFNDHVSVLRFRIAVSHYTVQSNYASGEYLSNVFIVFVFF